MRLKKRHIWCIVIAAALGVLASEIVNGGISLGPFQLDTGLLLRVFQDLGVAVAFSGAYLAAYKCFLWRLEFPVLEKTYDGTIVYQEKRKSIHIPVSIGVRQVMDEVTIELSSNLMKSETLNGRLREENGNIVIYTFIKPFRAIVPIKASAEPHDWCGAKTTRSKVRIGPTMPVGANCASMKPMN